MLGLQTCTTTHSQDLGVVAPESPGPKPVRDVHSYIHTCMYTHTHTLTTACASMTLLLSHYSFILVTTPLPALSPCHYSSPSIPSSLRPRSQADRALSPALTVAFPWQQLLSFVISPDGACNLTKHNSFVLKTGSLCSPGCPRTHFRPD